MFVLAAGVMGLGAVGSRRWMVGGAVIAAGGVVASLSPSLTTHAFTGANSLAMLLVALELRKPK